MLSNKVQRIPIDSIQTFREERQRREIDVSDIIESVKRRGVLTPICVTKSGRLVFGERRLTAAKQAGHDSILARIAPDDLTEHDLQLLELEENLMRAELPWQDKARAMAKLFTLSGQPSVQDFAASIGYDYSFVYKSLNIAEELLKENSRVATAPTMGKAINVVQRQRQREENNVIADILDTVGGGVEAPPLEQPADPILNGNFLEWAPAYSGPKFNLIHCDFPYGVDLQDSDQLQVGGTAHATYADTPDTFWQLLTCLAEQKDRILSHSCHMIFWHSMKEELYLPMRQFFRSRFAEWTFEDYPLVWLKSDNRGIAPDVERRPRRIYETALFGWRGERKLVKLGSNAYAAPKEASAHPSTKPEPVLRHFLSMVVDHHTRLLDPTCGSATALRAADSLGAASVLGLELDKSFADDAIARWRKHKSLAKLSEMVA